MELGESVVLRGQLAKMLGKGAEYSDEAVEIASLAGLLARLGKAADLVKRAQIWSEGAGKRLLAEGLDQLSADVLFDEFVSACAEDPSEAGVEDALFEFDELLVAIWWTGRAETAAALDLQMMAFITSAPALFQPFAEYAQELTLKFEHGKDRGCFELWGAIGQLLLLDT